jgi:N-acetylglucosaminyl-diphospho-decaprenol L-rhamnosyltransferase
MPDLFTVSVVSHGHAEQVRTLLAQLAKAPAGIIDKIVVTLNVPEEYSGWEGDHVQLVHNERPKGFGANHNHAFSLCNSAYFCVVNPDIEIKPCQQEKASGLELTDEDGGHGVQVVFDAVAKVLHSAGAQRVGLAYPAQCLPNGVQLDFARPLITPQAIFKRKLGFLAGVEQVQGRAEWVSGAFMAFRAEVFASLKGFDEGYFMYCEDVDICLRLQLAGYHMALAEVSVIHHTQRRTLKSVRHLTWHLRSLLRLWRSSTYHSYVRYVAMKNN